MRDRADREIQGAGQERQVPHPGTGGEEVRPLGYSTILSADVAEFLDKLPENIRNRIIRKIRHASSRPGHFFQRLSGRTDYRVIADIDWEMRLMTITAIGHRKNIYGRS
ncbi:type II toxin-antitoxin system RelE/ParE family toxin [Candidatus Woesearchaeota archaeon]|nr:type II toxin-antitoxin system RelE/ParE family toxin [Candidatus Woesearchaeota archaeon]